MTDKQDSNDSMRAMVQNMSIGTADPNLNLNEEIAHEQSRSKVKHSSSMNSMQDQKKNFIIEDNWMTKDLPDVNVPEKILFVVDTAKEADCTHFETRTSKFSPLYMMKRVIEIFVNVKLGMQNKHEFALMTLDANSVSWVADFTSSRKMFLSSLEKLEEDVLDEEQCIYDLGPCFEKIGANMELEDNRCPPPFVPRVILLYARSHSIPQFITGQHFFDILMGYENFFLDSLYIHEPLSDENECQAVYAKLSSLDVKQTSYILEVGRNAATVHTNMAKLLAHPLQRARQDTSSYSYQRTPGSP